MAVTRTPASAAPCVAATFTALSRPDTTITLVESLPAGTNPPPVGTIAVPICRVAGVVTPAINFEVWMPSGSDLTSRWNGKFQGVGNGGFAGTISFGAMRTAVARRYATGSTDTGHKNTDPLTWMQDRQQVVDYGYRAIHEMTVKAKAIVRAFYGGGPGLSYWNGCSTGGRQGLMEIERYPDDYDGALIGAPANPLTRLQMGGNWISQAIHEAPETFISAAKLPAITNAVLARCDNLDGIPDGVLDDPRRCDFDPAALLCTGAETNACLTAPQLEGLKKVYAGATNSSGAQIFPGYLPGAESFAGSWAVWIAGTNVPPTNLQHAIQDQFFRFMVFENASYDSLTFDFDDGPAATDDKQETPNETLAEILNAVNPDLSSFNARGGRIVWYHGWNDPAISPLNSVDLFRAIVRFGGAKRTDEFLRLFMVPGMLHCSGGPGPNTFDALGALERWVEQGQAPDMIVASGGALPTRTRPLCPYPQVARHDGTGSTDDAANFVCELEGLDRADEASGFDHGLHGRDNARRKQAR
jgi:feruloyl esterase